MKRREFLLRLSKDLLQLINYSRRVEAIVLPVNPSGNHQLTGWAIEDGARDAPPGTRHLCLE